MRLMDLALIRAIYSAFDSSAFIMSCYSNVSVVFTSQATNNQVLEVLVGRLVD